MTKRLSRRALLKSAAALAAARHVACAEEPSTADLRAETILGPDGAAPGSLDAFDSGTAACVECPTAHIVPGATAAAADALAAALRGAGFAVAQVDPERSPAELRGLIVIPSNVSESPDYSRYLDRYGADLLDVVDRGNVLLQLAQSERAEPTPPLLPATRAVTRRRVIVEKIKVHGGSHALLRNMAIAEGSLAWDPQARRSTAFERAEGFEVILSEQRRTFPLLLEGAHGRGRIVLSALPFDAPETELQSAASAELFANMLQHVRAVSEGRAPALVVGGSAAATAFTPGSSMIAVLPDTQVYSMRLPGIYHAQTSFLRLYAERLDIKYVLHLGDIVNNNTRVEWQRAAAAMSLLHDVVPYALVTGNHDHGPSGDASTRDTYLNEYFSYEQAAAMPSFGGAYEHGKLESTYHLFSMKGRDFIVIALEWAPRDEVVAWADEIMRCHPDREGILVTHAYLNSTSLRFDHTDTQNSQRNHPSRFKTPGSINDGEQLWQKLVRHHRFVMTLNGHVVDGGFGYLKSTTDRGSTCHQMLSNYQMRTQGGEGYMRLLELLPDGRTLRVHTYSPLYDDLLAEPGHNFDVELD